MVCVLKHGVPIKGIQFINDSLSSDGSFLSIVELEKIKMNYLHYFSLRIAIRKCFDVSSIRKMSEPVIPGTLSLIFMGARVAHIFMICY